MCAGLTEPWEGRFPRLKKTDPVKLASSLWGMHGLRVGTGRTGPIPTGFANHAYVSLFPIKHIYIYLNLIHLLNIKQNKIYAGDVCVIARRDRSLSRVFGSLQLWIRSEH
jgi:hypothetical protein